MSACQRHQCRHSTDTDQSTEERHKMSEHSVSTASFHHIFYMVVGPPVLSMVGCWWGSAAGKTRSANVTFPAHVRNVPTGCNRGCCCCCADKLDSERRTLAVKHINVVLQYNTHMHSEPGSQKMPRCTDQNHALFKVCKWPIPLC